MSKIDFFISEDGSIGLYNKEISDIYHSRTGALTESIEKFIIPTNFQKFAQNNQEIKLLDFCYGIGYNTKNAIKFATEANPNIKLDIDAIDIDPTVVFLSGILNSQYFDNIINYKILEEIIHQYTKFSGLDLTLIKSSKILKFLMPYFSEGDFFVNLEDTDSLFNEIKQKLHNIYYQYVSKRNKNNFSNPILPNITINFHIDDARQVIKNLNTKYDFIFFDAFTPALIPSLWTKEMFLALKNKLKPNGILATYSSALTARSALLNAGFEVGKIINPSGRSIGTLATIDKFQLEHPLSEYDLALINDTKAGIFYRDIDFSLSNQKILENYNEEKKYSAKQSSSSFIKKHRGQK